MKKFFAKIASLFTKKQVVKTVEMKAEELVGDLKIHIIELGEEVESALDMFKHTVKKLQRIDDTITEKRVMIKSYADQLSALDEDLQNKQDANNKVKAKFEDFLS